MTGVQTCALPIYRRAGGPRHRRLSPLGALLAGGLAGWDPDLLTQFGLGATARKKFTAYGSVRDKRNGVAIEAKAVLEGRLGTANPEAFQRGELQGFDYAINEILHYELYFEGAEKYYWDFFTTDWRVNGTSQNADERSILRLPNGF